jgi:hypothetical protein
VKCEINKGSGLLYYGELYEYKTFRCWDLRVEFNSRECSYEKPTWPTLGTLSPPQLITTIADGIIMYNNISSRSPRNPFLAQCHTCYGQICLHNSAKREMCSVFPKPSNQNFGVWVHTWMSCGAKDLPVHGPKLNLWVSNWPNCLYFGSLGGFRV